MSVLTISMLPEQYLHILRKMLNLGELYPNELAPKQKTWVTDMVRMKLIIRHGTAKTWSFIEISERGACLLNQGWTR
jgi:hypothetical protein